MTTQWTRTIPSVCTTLQGAVRELAPTRALSIALLACSRPGRAHALSGESPITTNKQYYIIKIL